MAAKKTVKTIDVSKRLMAAAKRSREFGAYKSVRLDLPTADYDRLERCAKARGLSMAAYSRQAVLMMIRGDEREERGE